MNITQAHHDFIAVEALPTGMDTPYYIARYIYAGDVAHLTLRNGAVVHIGHRLLSTFAKVREFHTASQPTGTPVAGWNAIKIVCWQCGGMTMVDVVTFANGWRLSLSDECVMLWEPGVEVFDEDEGWYLELPMGVAL